MIPLEFLNSENSFLIESKNYSSEIPTFSLPNISRNYPFPISIFDIFEYVFGEYKKEEKNA